MRQNINFGYDDKVHIFVVHLLPAASLDRLVLEWQLRAFFLAICTDALLLLGILLAGDKFACIHQCQECVVLLSCALFQKSS